MYKKLYSLLTTPLPPEHRKGFNHEIVRSSFWPILTVGFIVIAFEIGMIALFLSNASLFEARSSRIIYFILYIILLTVTTGFVVGLILIRKLLEKKPEIFRFLTIIYCLLISIWGSFLSAFAHRNGKDDITVFIYVVVCSAVVATMQLWQASLVYMANFCAFHVFLSFFSPADSNTWGSLLNALIVTFLAIAITTILYHSKAINYLNTATIQAQSQKIRSINEQLQALVLTDDLTKARNRRFFEEVLPARLEIAFNDKKSVSVMMLDIDFFKGYNDIYGHQAGDTCLQTLAALVREVTQNETIHFIRYGGEEFLIFLTDSAQEHTIEIAENVRAAVDDNNIVHIGSTTGNLTISIGVYYCAPSRSEVSLQRLVHNADEALYHAKNTGRNRVELYGTFSPSARTASTGAHL